jgi:hypothetical protein
VYFEPQISIQGYLARVAWGVALPGKPASAQGKLSYLPITSPFPSPAPGGEVQANKYYKRRRNNGRQGPTTGRLLTKIKQFHFKKQGRLRRDDTTGSHVTVRVFRRTFEDCLLALFHRRHAFLPPQDHWARSRVNISPQYTEVPRYQSWTATVVRTHTLSGAEAEFEW